MYKPLIVRLYVNKLRLPFLAIIGALALMVASYSVGQASTTSGQGGIKTCGAEICTVNQAGATMNPLDTQNLVTSNTGHYIEIPYGSLSPVSSPVSLTDVFGFGTVTATRCDLHGNSQAVFTNTTNHTLISFYSEEEIPPGGTIDGENGFLLLLINGKGPNSSLTQIQVNSWNRKDKRVCALQGNRSS
jgi:hypothetical protein